MNPHYRMRHRVTDEPRQGRFWIFVRRAYLVWVAIVPAIAVAAACVAVFRNEQTIEQVQRTQQVAGREVLERRDQTCRIFEAQHLANVAQLRATYEFLDDLPRSEWGSNLTRAIVRGLPAQEAEARTDQAPPYCDEPGKLEEDLYKRSHGTQGAPPVGLPEPDPIVPPRKYFRYLNRKP